MKYKSLLDSLPLVAEMIGKTHGVKVFIGKLDRACRVGKAEIHLPALDPDDDKTLVLARGYLDHEVGHVRFTTPGIKAKAGSRFGALLWNIIEDVRIESLMSREYPGCKRNLDNLWSAVEIPEQARAQGAKSLAEVPEESWSIPDKIAAHLVQRARAEVIGQSKPRQTALETEQVFRKALGAKVTRHFNAMMDEIGALKDSEGALELAKRMEAYLRKHMPPPPPQKKEEDDKKPGNPGSTPPQGSGDGSESGSAEQAGAPASSKSNGTESESGNPLDGPIDAQSPLELAKAAMEAASEEAVREQRAVSCGGGASADLASTPLNGPPIDRVRVAGKTAALRARMGGLLQTLTVKRVLPAERGQRLLSRRLARVGIGDARIFARPTAVERTDTLVTVLVDRSDSMSLHQRVATAMEAAFGICIGLEELHGVRYACHAFPGVHEATVPVLRLGERAMREAKRFVVSASGGTPMADALWHVARVTALEPEPRKLILVATDGAPNNEEATQDVITRLERQGYEVMGIGIGVDVSRLFRPSATITDIEGLAPAMFKMLTEALVRYKARKAA